MKLKYPGIAVYFNGQNYYIPSLSTADFRANSALLTTPLPEGTPLKDQIDAYLPIVGIAIRRNYPDVTDEQLAEWLDLYTFPLAIKAVQNASGLTPATEGE